MVRAVGKADGLSHQESFLDLISGWHASIGKAVLENWGFAEQMYEAVAEQADFDRKHKGDAELADVLIVGIVLGGILNMPGPRVIDMDGIDAFAIIGLSEKDCTAILTHAELQLGSLQDALGC